VRCSYTGAMGPQRATLRGAVRRQTRTHTRTSEHRTVRGRLPQVRVPCRRPRATTTSGRRERQTKPALDGESGIRS
jgi:hypothetical protein